MFVWEDWEGLVGGDDEGDANDDCEADELCATDEEGEGEGDEVGTAELAEVLDEGVLETDAGLLLGDEEDDAGALLVGAGVEEGVLEELELELFLP